MKIAVCALLLRVSLLRQCVCPAMDRDEEEDRAPPEGSASKKKKLTKRIRPHTNPYTPPAAPPPISPDAVEWHKIFTTWEPGASVEIADIGVLSCVRACVRARARVCVCVRAGCVRVCARARARACVFLAHIALLARLRLWRARARARPTHARQVHTGLRGAHHHILVALHLILTHTCSRTTQIRDAAVDFVREQFIKGQATEPGLARIGVCNVNCQKHLPNYFRKGQLTKSALRRSLNSCSRARLTRPCCVTHSVFLVR